MGLGFMIGRALGKAAKAAFVPTKADAPSVWNVKERFIHNSIKNYNDPRLAGWFQNYKHAPIDNKELIRQGIEELPKDKSVSAEYLEKLINGAMNKYQMQTIRAYLKSSAANNLDAHTRTDLWMACAQRMHYLTTLFDFMN